MKIKSIAAICKKNKQVVLFNRYSDSGTLSQYIGDGNAVYPISGLPELDEESILTIFDVLVYAARLLRQAERRIFLHAGRGGHRQNGKMPAIFHAGNGRA